MGVGRFLVTKALLSEALHLPQTATIRLASPGSSMFSDTVEIEVDDPGIHDLNRAAGELPPLVRPTFRYDGLRTNPVVFVGWGQDKVTS